MEDMTLFGSGYGQKTRTKDQSKSSNTETLQYHDDFLDANLSDDILFTVFMKNKEFCKMVLSIILERDVIDVTYHDTQKSIANMMHYRGIRLDVYAKLKDGSICNVEMQNTNNDNLPKRSRYYQGLLDSVVLPSGSLVKYKDLPNSIVIFITGFDPFHKGLYRYSFSNVCKEVPELELEDAATKIFLSTCGKIRNGESQLLIDFLHYVAKSTDDNARKDSVLEKIHKQVLLLKGDPAMRDEYMSYRGLRAEILAQAEEAKAEAEEAKAEAKKAKAEAEEAKAEVEEAKAKVEEAKAKSAMTVINTLKRYKVPKPEIISNLCNQLNCSIREAEDLYDRSE